MAGFTDVHNRLMSVYPDVGEIWYFAVLCFAILCGCLGVGLWVIPVGIIRSITGLEVTMNVLAEFIGGSWVAGKSHAVSIYTRVPHVDLGRKRLGDELLQEFRIHYDCTSTPVLERSQTWPLP
jgi:hypothetical protein